MSGSETGVITSENNLGMQTTPAASSQPVIHNMQLAYTADGNAVYKPIPSSLSPYEARTAGNGAAADGGGMNMSMGMASEPLKKKRGRPRKYGPDGAMAVPISSVPPAANVTQPSTFSQPPAPPQQQLHQQQQPQQQQMQQQMQQPQPQQQQQMQQQQPQGALPVSGGLVSPGPQGVRKPRGRPPGSSRKQPQQLSDAMGSPGIGFTPHVITVKAGENVASKIMSFSQNGPRAICILSANGAISNATLRQTAATGGLVSYQGRFEILSLSGSFMLTDTGGPGSRSGGISVSLAGPDGRVVGGGVVGLLTAASPVQVVVGSFISDSWKETNVANQMDPPSAPSKNHAGIGATGPSSPTSHGTPSESSGGTGSPLHQSTGAVNSTPLGMSGLPWK